MAKIGQNRPKWPLNDVNDIKKLCFLYQSSSKPSLEYGPNRFLAQKLAKKIDPTL
jgi:hypothetical protein